MNSLFKPVLALLVIVLIFLLSLSIFHLPAARTIDAAKNEFSSARALRHVEKLAVRPHPVGSPEHSRVRDYILNVILKLGLKPEIHKGYGENDAVFFTDIVPYAGLVENISVRLKGSAERNQAILMLAHYDTTFGGPGAADDSSGVAVLLETLRALKSCNPLKNDVIFLFTDGEEAGLLGSKLYAETAWELKNIFLAMNFDSRGSKGPSILFETSDHNEWLMKEFKKAAPYPVAYSFTSDVFKIISDITDFTPFKDAGKSGFNFANLGGMEVYHNPQDTPENLDQRYLQHQGSYALSLAKHFGNMPFQNVKSGNAIYFTITKSIMVLYPEKWALPLAIVAFILLAAVIIVGYRKRLVSVKGLIYGFSVSILMFLTALLTGICIQALFSRLYYKMETVRTLADLIDLRRLLILKGNHWIILSMVLTMIVLTILHRLFRRRIFNHHLLLGHAITWCILVFLSSIYSKGASYLLVWPLILVLAGLLYEISRKGHRSSDFKFFIPFMFSAVSCILLFVPLFYMMFQALTMLGSGLIIGILALPVSMVTANTFLYLDTK